MVCLYVFWEWVSTSFHVILFVMRTSKHHSELEVCMKLIDSTCFDCCNTRVMLFFFKLVVCFGFAPHVIAWVTYLLLLFTWVQSAQWKIHTLMRECFCKVCVCVCVFISLNAPHFLNPTVYHWKKAKSVLIRKKSYL